MTIHKGDAYSIPFAIKRNGQAVKEDDVDEVEISFGRLHKYFSKGEVTFTNDCWLFPISQKETFGFAFDFVIVQVRVLFKNGDCRTITLPDVKVEGGLSHKVLGDE